MTNFAGHAGRHPRPLHPPFTHFPIAAYVLAAGFDVVSAIGGGRHQWAGQLWHAGTYVLVAGLAICLLTMVTGFADLVRFGEYSADALRVIATHVGIQAGVFMIGVADVALRLTDASRASTPPAPLALTITAAVAVCVGGYFGGTLVYRHGTGVAAPARDTPAHATPAHATPAHATPAHATPAQATPAQAAERNGFAHRARHG
jgi:uncharacterized membrane protein